MGYRCFTCTNELQISKDGVFTYKGYYYCLGCANKLGKRAMNTETLYEIAHNNKYTREERIEQMNDYLQKQEGSADLQENKRIEQHDLREAEKELFFTQAVSLENFVKKLAVAYNEDFSIKKNCIPGYVIEDVNDIRPDNLEPHEKEFIAELINEELK
jgi:hypothetical protein